MSIGFALVGAAVLFGQVTQLRTMGLLLAATALCASWIGGRWRWERLPQLAAASVITSAVSAAMFGATDTGDLHPFFAALAVSAIVVAASRLLLRQPLGGPAATVGIGLASILACGTERNDAPFGSLLAIYVTLGLVAIRLGDRGRPSWRTYGPRWIVLGSVGVVLSAGLAVMFAAVLPRLHDRLAPWSGYRNGPRAGFSGESFRLGSLRNLQQSDDVVLRVHGPEVTHLRGEIYRRYGSGRWYRSSERAPNLTTYPETVDTAVAMGGIENEVWVADRETRHVFLPLDCSAVHAQPDRVQWTPEARVRSGRGEPIESYGFAR
ncbi:MAG: DUF3488 domain-containing protein, partial [Planctomycetes bacterium]|nr:DUF3488 domain-containing protein [Planctomycetota bacterium]